MKELNVQYKYLEVAVRFDGTHESEKKILIEIENIQLGDNKNKT